MRRFILWICFIGGAAGIVMPVQATETAVTDTLSNRRVIRSQILDYGLQFWVYTPPGHESMDKLPALYVSDGAWYLKRGGLAVIADSMIAIGEIEPLVIVFLDARNPDNLDINRRNEQFFCNPRFIDFVRDELVPRIDRTYHTFSDRTARSILGLSFGGLNSACFGLHAHDTFEGIAMQSPAMHLVKTIHQAYADSRRLPIKVFLSSGDHRDNEDRTRKLRDILEDKEYPLHYMEVPFAHNWMNWKPLLDDILTYFYASDSTQTN